MQFLDRFTRAEAARLLDAGRRMRLGRGDYLMRRGDKGGDLYLVESGALEVVDTRSRPEVVLDVLGPGALGPAAGESFPAHTERRSRLVARVQIRRPAKPGAMPLLAPADDLIAGPVEVTVEYQVCAGEAAGFPSRRA